MRKSRSQEGKPRRGIRASTQPSTIHEPRVAFVTRAGGKMKRIGCLLLVILGSAILLSAQTQSQTESMSGWICNASCVVQHSGAATCDPTCGSTTGTAVFVSDEGKVS